MNYLKSLGIDPRLIKIGEIVMSGVRRFLELDDTPDSYDGQAGKVVKVNEGETALKFEEMPGGDMLKSVYDTNDDGMVDNADKVDGQHASEFAAASHNHDSAYAPISKGVTNGDSHDHAGGDGAAITENALSLSDVTTANASTTKHGFCPKLPDDDTKFLDGKGNWSAPSGEKAGFKGKIIYADSPDHDDVEAAINQAGIGDMVVVPNGTATWSEALIINKGIVLKAASPRGVVISGNFTGHDYNDPASHIITYVANSDSSNGFRLSGFILDADSDCLPLYVGTDGENPLRIIDRFRIDYCEFKNGYLGRAAEFVGEVYGVIDHCIFRGADSSFGFRNFSHDTTTWENMTFDFGSANQIYFEDNIFYSGNYGGFFQGARGGRYCARYNTFYHQGTGMSCQFDMHGNISGGNLSTMGAEVYENIFYNNNKSFRLFGQRGGKALVYNNAVYDAYDSWWAGTIEEEVYDYLNPPETNPAGQPQHVSDSYFWNNIINGTNRTEETNINGYLDYGGDKGLVPRWDVHAWKQDLDFDGSSGVGAGLLSERPSSCSTEGVAWWATDENKLYRWHNGAWELYYTPYTYPHPLRTILGEFITECDIGLSDVETNNVSTETHGFCPKLSGNIEDFLRGDGQFAPPDGGGSSDAMSQAINPIKRYGSNTYWVGLDGGITPTTTTFTANRLYVYPISFDHDVSVSTVAIQVTTAASGNAKVGLYGATYDDGWKPATLLGSTSDLDISTTGTKTASVSWNLSKHTVYFVGLIPSVAPALRSQTSSYCRVLFVILSETSLNKCHMLTYDVGSYSLPSDLSSVTFAYSNASPPMIAFA